MSANSFGSRFVVTTFGESHGPAVGAVIDGCPAGVPFDLSLLTMELVRRRPTQQGTLHEGIVSGRNEADVPEILSGVFEGSTLGSPIAIIVRNIDSRPQDYELIAQQPRNGHADDLWQNKYGVLDPRGGGRASGRETVARVMGGCIAKMALRHLVPDLRVLAFAKQIGPFRLRPHDETQLASAWKAGGDVDGFLARFPSPELSSQVRELLTAARQQGESYGATVETWVSGGPAGLGQPVFHKLKADLAAAYMGVGAVAGVEIGAGMGAADATGCAFHSLPDSRAYGGIRGGISTGEDIVARIALKPPSSVGRVAREGRHDPCIVTRAIPVLEAMTWIVLADHVLWRRTDRI